MSPPRPVLDALPSSLLSIPPEHVAFVSGAGISIDAPTGNPAGDRLTEMAIDAYFPPGTQAVLADIFAALHLNRVVPRLEVVLASVFDANGAAALSALLTPLSLRPPNALHRFFAQHRRAGGTHVTANFDMLIEHAMDNLDGESLGTAHVVHFHGTLGVDHISDLGARFERIESGFSPTTTAQLDDALFGDQVRAIVFVGYSGRDHYDFTPYFLSRSDALRSREVIWIEDARGVLNSPLIAGHHTIVRGVTSDLLRMLAVRWGFPPVSHGGGRAFGGQAPPAAPPVSELVRLRTAADLYGRMGLRKLALEAGLKIPAHDRTAAEWSRLADAHWGRGEFGAWLAGMERALGSDDQSDAALAHAELRARFDWITGRLLAAAATARRAYSMYLDDARVAPSTWLRLLETYARTLDHMTRLPDTRWLVSHRRVVLVGDALELALRAATGQTSLASANTARAALSDLLGSGVEAQTLAHEHIMNDFSESDFLSAWMSYRHGSIRRSTLASYERHALVERLRADEEVIGALAEIDRTYLLPGEAGYLSWRELLRLFGTVEYTAWHRLRLRAGIAIHKLVRS